MRRFLLTVLLVSAGNAALVSVAGGVGGLQARQADPEVESARQRRDSMAFGGAPGTRVQEIEDARVGAPPIPHEYVDAATGETVLIRDFVRWTVSIQRALPAEGDTNRRQRARAEDVRLRMYRPPETLEEALAVANGEAGAMHRLLQWTVTAGASQADFINAALAGSDEARENVDPDAVIQLTDGVTIRDEERNLVIQGEEIEVHANENRARGAGPFQVRHEAFHMAGVGLELARKDMGDELRIRRAAEIHVFGSLALPDGRTVIELDDEDMRPGLLQSDGGALLVREIDEANGAERLHFTVEDNVRVQQEGGRQLLAERVAIRGSRPLTAPEGAPAPPWRAERFEANGNVELSVPKEEDGGKTFVLALGAQRLLHVLHADGTRTTTLEGQPRLTMRGDLPLDALPARERHGLLIASARNRARLEPAPLTDVPPDAERTSVLRLVLEGDARVERHTLDGAGVSDTLEGDHMALVIREQPGDPTAVGDRRSQRYVAVGFAVTGDVTMGGSRVSGWTHRLIGQHLDSQHPALIAEGPGTSFVFHDLASGERLLGGSPSRRPQAPSAPGADPDAAPRREWALERVHAGGGVTIQTSFGGAVIGIPAELEGRELTYDRISDRARMRGGPTSPARIRVMEPGTPGHELTARSMGLDRASGTVDAEGRVRGTLHLREQDEGAGVAIAVDALQGNLSTAPRSFRVATDGRIEVRGHVLGKGIDPAPETEQVVRIEGGVVAEVTSAMRAIDSLRCAELEVAFVQLTANAPPAPSAPTAQPGRPGSAGSRSVPALPTGAPVRWEIETERITARVGGGGLERFEAVNGVQVTGDDGQVVGEVLTYDAATRVLNVRGGSEGLARATFGEEDFRSEVLASALSVLWATGGPERLAAHAPAHVLMIRRRKDLPTGLERFVVSTKGDLVMTPSTLTTLEHFEIRRSAKERPELPWEPASVLWADRLDITGRHLLDREDAEVDRIVASGPRTTLRTGAGEGETTVWGHRFDLDVRTSLATLSAAPGQQLTVRRGPEGRDDWMSRQTKIVINLETGMIRDVADGSLIIRGEGRTGR